METLNGNAKYESESNISDDLREKYIFSYFSRTNCLNKHILTQQKSLGKYLEDRWNHLPPDRQDLLVDYLLVNDEVRNQHTSCSGNMDALNHISSSGPSEIQESFPRLFLNSGQKINVDFESDLWTWRDEHSGPFSWYSKSQQDLTLTDLEPDNISKPQPKTSRADTDDEENVKKCEPQFTYPSSCWCHDVIGEYKKHEKEISVSPSNSIYFSSVAKVEASSEEVNPAFEGSLENLPKVADVNKCNEKEEMPSAATKETERKSRHKNRSSSRSPSPKKILRPSSLKRSPSKEGDEKLINKDDTDTESNAFSNPAMESEWSTFVGEETCEAHMSDQVNLPITTAPEALNMDRGCDLPNDSPYRGDEDFLIQPSVSPAAHNIAADVAPCPPSLSHTSSEETTPDHTTHLLKGMQSPVHATHKTKYLTENSLAMNSADLADPGIEIKSDVDEVLQVEKEGDKFFFNTKVENKRDSDIPMSGFDFLDNW